MLLRVARLSKTIVFIEVCTCYFFSACIILKYPVIYSVEKVPKINKKIGISYCLLSQRITPFITISYLN